MLSSSSSSYALELQALKVELQLTLARLGDINSRPNSAPSLLPSAAAAAVGTPEDAPWSVASTRTLTTARSTPSLSHAPAAADARAPRNPQQLVRELRLAAQRRRELEAELTRELAREQQRVTQAPWQSAIAALRRQRAEIAREMEAERSQDLFGADERSSGRGRRVLYRDSATQMSPVPPTLPPPRHTTQATVVGAAEKQFSIEGVVTLEPIREDEGAAQRSAAAQTTTQTLQHRASETESRQHNAARQREIPSRLPETHHLHHLHHHDALNEVFSIQLKFAETMLKLEKSVQIREQLLQRSIAPPMRGQHARRGRARAAATARGGHTGQQLSDPDSYYGEDMSSDYDSFSSGASLGEYAMRLRRYTSDNDDDLLVNAGRVRDAATAAAAASSHANTAAATAASQANHFNRSAVEEESGRNTNDDGGVGDSDSAGTPLSTHEPRTPSTENSVKTSTSSETKKVRFGDGGDEYATPLIAKKFTFENQSDDDDDDNRAGDGDDGSESALSFMGGSSVTSAELNDVSLVKAFEAFRLELGMLKAASPQLFSSRSAPSGVSAAISAARKLFADGKTNPSNGDRRTVVLKPAQPSAVIRAKTVDAAQASGAQKPVVVAKAAVDSSTAADHSRDEQFSNKCEQQHEVSETDRASLRERRRQLCLDIQDESAQLVLTFGSRNAHETERIKQTLIELRKQLRCIDEQLAL